MFCVERNAIQFVNYASKKTVFWLETLDGNITLFPNTNALGNFIEHTIHINVH